ncbi:MAG TPA: nucleotide sugar dehydrogenase [Kiloniellales bacterium]
MDLAEKIRTKDAQIGVIGLGYVGLPLALTTAEAGFSVTGFDIDPAKVTALNAGRSYIGHIAAGAVKGARESGRFAASADFASLNRIDVILICVPTPLTAQREPDMTFVTETAEQIAAHLRPGQLVILESTTYPGTTAHHIRPILERGGLKSGDDFFLAYSPEREDPGNPDYSTKRIAKVVGGDGKAALDLGVAFYEQIVPRVVPVSGTDTAEAVKLTENIFRAVNIALVNELKVIYDAMGIDIWEVIEAAKTKPFGYMPFYPGPGLGGHCIPIDPFYLTWKAREHDVSTRFIELAGEVNAAMPRYVVERLTEGLNDRFGLGLKGARILVLGIAYKKNVDDVRGSASFKIIRLLKERGAEVSYHDPHVSVVKETRDYPDLAGMKSIPWDPKRLSRFSAAVILTDHDGVDYQTLVRVTPLVVDTRNVTAALAPKPDNVLKA